MAATILSSGLIPATGNTGSMNKSGNAARSGKSDLSFNEMLGNQVKAQGANKTPPAPTQTTSATPSSSDTAPPAKSKKSSKSDADSPSTAAQEAGAAAMAAASLPADPSNKPASSTTPDSDLTKAAGQVISATDPKASQAILDSMTTVNSADLADAAAAAAANTTTQTPITSDADKKANFLITPPSPEALTKPTPAENTAAATALQPLMNDSGIVNKGSSLDDKKVTVSSKNDSAENSKISTNPEALSANAIRLASDSSTGSSAFSDKPPTSNLPELSIKTAHQGLDASQLNALAPVLSAPPKADNVTAAAANDIRQPVGTPDWDKSIGQKIAWMANGGHQTASLTLNPPDLGPLQVVLSVSDHHANATFISHQPEVRTALENAIPKLREMMGQSGIQLGECNVNSQTNPRHNFAQNNSGGGNGHGSGSRIAAVNGNDTQISALSSNRSGITGGGNGMVDTFV